MAATVRSKFGDLLIIYVYLSLGIIAGVESVIECNGNWDCRDDNPQSGGNIAGFSVHVCWPATARGRDHFARNKAFSDDGHGFIYWNSAQHSVVYQIPTNQYAANLTVYALNYNGRNLFGWLHVVLQARNSLNKVIIQVETEENQEATAGSFIELPVTGACKHVGPGPTTKSDYRPCETAMDPFPDVHQQFGRRYYQANTNVYRWNVKLSFPLCSIYYDKNPFYFRTYIFTRLGMALPTQKRIALHEFVYGAADPAPPANSAPDCSQQISTAIPWVQRVDSDAIGVKFYRWAPHENVYSVSWGGRCNLGFDPNYSQRKQDHDASTAFRYHCRRRRAAFLPFGRLYTGRGSVTFTNPEPEKWSSMYPEITLYYQQLLDEIAKQCANNCSLYAGQEYSQLLIKGLDASTEIASYVWGGRQAHGILMAIACLFVYPVSNFMTRYFKGTFMNSRVVVNLHVWYSVHLYAIFTAGTLLVVSLGIAIYARKFFGYSDTAAGKTHVSMGYFALFFFFADFVYMGWRCGEEEGRNCAILLHFLLGAAFYFTSLVAIITSIYVPGSPGSLKDEEKDNLDTGSFILLAVVVKVWPIFECVIHVFATLQLCRTDRKSAVLRDWAFLLVPIPRVGAGERKDEEGTAFRVCLLQLFVVCSLVATWVAVSAIGASQPKGHLMGPMTLTHVDGKFTDEYIGVVQDFPDVV